MAENKNYTEKKDIFISYRREGAEDFARQLQQSLEQKGYSVFLDVENIRPGTQFNEKLYDVIDNCKDFILVLPKNGLDRCQSEDDWVRLEIERAREKGKNIIPVRLRGFEMPKELPASLEFLRKQHGLTPTTEFYDAFVSKLSGSLISRPKFRPKWWVIALAAVVLAVAGWLCYDKYSKYPHNREQEQLVSQLITYMALNMQNYDNAHSDFMKGLEEAENYLEGKSKLDQEGVQLLLGNQRDTISVINSKIKEFSNPEGLVKSPFEVADIDSFPITLRTSLDDMAGSLDHLSQWIGTGRNEEYCLKYVKLLKEYADLDVDVQFYLMNGTLLPVTNEEALKELKTVYLPKISSMRGKTLLKDADTIEGLIETAFSRQVAIFSVDIPNIYEAIGNDLEDAEFEVQLLEIQLLKNYYADDPEMLQTLEELETRYRNIQEKKQYLEELEEKSKQQETELEAAKRNLYIAHQPLETDDQDTLWTKGRLFLTFEMYDEAKKCFEIYQKHGGPVEQVCGTAAIKFIDFRADLPELIGGVVVFGYEEGKEPQDVMIGDIIYAVDGQPIAYLEQFKAAKADGGEHTVSILRFHDTGYELVTSVNDPNKGGIYLYSLVQDSEE